MSQNTNAICEKLRVRQLFGIELSVFEIVCYRENISLPPLYMLNENRFLDIFLGHS